AVPTGWGKKRPSLLGCGRRTDDRWGHGVVTTHSGSYWIINTLGNMYKNLYTFLLTLRFGRKSLHAYNLQQFAYISFGSA
ncbi:hypothetical protein HMPREF0083_02988, partial [Aneurinibacillus aneurinilyticus ATCC 12856]